MPKDTLHNKRQNSSQELSLSQSSNLEGGEEAMSLLIKAQATAAKNKKTKENQHLNSVKELLDHTLGACAQDYATAIGELQELYQAFQMELAASYDRERKHWMEAVAEQESFKAKELIGTCQHGEEAREKDHIDALATTRSSMKSKTVGGDGLEGSAANTAPDRQTQSPS